MRPSARRAGTGLSVLVSLAVASSATAVGSARADGDPASDVLLAQNVFYPYQPKVDPRLERTLESTLVAAGRASGAHFKVAIIESAPELGLVPQYFGHSQAYANFLDREISFNAPQALLTVMPSGYGVVPARDRPAVARIAVSSKEGSDGLTRSAIAAVLALSRYLGHPIPQPPIASRGSSGGAPPGLVFGLPVALLLSAGLTFAALGRRRRRSPRPD